MVKIKSMIAGIMAFATLAATTLSVSAETVEKIGKPYTKSAHHRRLTKRMNMTLSCMARVIKSTVHISAAGTIRFLS